MRYTSGFRYDMKQDCIKAMCRDDKRNYRVKDMRDGGGVFFYITKGRRTLFLTQADLHDLAIAVKTIMGMGFSGCASPYNDLLTAYKEGKI